MAPTDPLFDVSGYSATFTYVYDDTSQTPVVPLPASGWGLLAALGSLVALRRRA